MGTLQGSWVWYELITADPEGAKAFYETVVGWSMTTGAGDDNNYGFITGPDGGMTGGVMPLTHAMASDGARPGWLGYIGVDNVDTSAAAIKAAGGKILMAPRDIAMAGRVAMVADCCGAPFYVMTPNPPPGGGESTAFASKPNPGHCGWNELLASDAAKSAAFYSSQFAWTLPDPMDMGPMGKYQFIAHDDVTMGAIMTKPDMLPAPAWCFYFWTDSITAAIPRITAAGGHVVNGPHEVPGPLWVVQAVDPQGIMFALTGGK